MSLPQSFVIRGDIKSKFNIKQSPFINYDGDFNKLSSDVACVKNPDNISYTCGTACDNEYKNCAIISNNLRITSSNCQ